jgi:hypothetical protein
VKYERAVQQPLSFISWEILTPEKEKELYVVRVMIGSLTIAPLIKLTQTWTAWYIGRSVLILLKVVLVAQ